MFPSMVSLVLICSAIGTVPGQSLGENLPEHNKASSNKEFRKSVKERVRTSLSTLCSETTGNEWCYVNPGIGKQDSHPPYLRETATAAYKRSAEARLRKTILFGGSPANGVAVKTHTWIYTPWTNSWMKRTLHPSPSNRKGHSMVTLCETKIFLHGGTSFDDQRIRYIYNDTWIFNGATETWTKAKITGDSAPVPQRRFFPALSIFQPETNCSCKESLICFGGELRKYIPLSRPVFWELRCVDEEKNLYQWLKQQAASKTEKPPPAAEFAFGSAVTITTENKRKLIANGGSKNGFTPQPYLWQVDITTNNWTLLNNFSLESQDAVKSKAFGSMFLFDIHKIILFANQATVFAYNIRTNTWMNVTCRFCSPPQPANFRPTKNKLKIDNTILSFGIGEEIPDQPFNAIVLNLSITEVNVPKNSIEIAWTVNPPPLASPFSLFPGSYSSALLKNSIYIYGGLLSDNSFRLFQYNSDFLATTSIWILDILTLSWGQINPEYTPPSLANHCGAAINNDIFIQYGGNSGFYNSNDSKFFSLLDLTREEMVEFNKTVQGNLWGFNTTSRFWLKQMKTSSSTPQRRFRCTMSSLSNGSAFLFGGLTVSTTFKFQSLNDLWILTFKSCNISKTGIYQWRQLFKACSSNENCQGPQPRFNNIFEVVNSNPVVFGGTNPSNFSKSCYDKFIWQFSLETLSWLKTYARSAQPNYIVPSSKRRRGYCFSTGASIGNQLIVSLFYLKKDYSTADCRLNYLSCQESQTFAADASTNRDQVKWIKLGAVPFGIVQGALHNYRGKIISIGTFNGVNPSGVNSPSIAILTQPGCPKGEFSSNFSTHPCEFCGFSKYSPAASEQCFHCPIGSRTTFKNAESITNCTCAPNYCLHGNCLETNNYEGKKTITCLCFAGFTGATCKYPTYYLIGTGVVILTALLTLLIVSICRYRKASAIEKEKLRQLKTTFTIPESELVLIGRTDEDCRGGYSEVYKGKYRGMAFVAVKRLLMDLTEIDKSVLLEFIREIEIMSLLSHKNIIKFFGAGRSEETNGPFLVLEYAKLGTLKNILYASPNFVTFDRKCNFALDTARGMDYLHSQKPPRIHRDLKTANLLVDENWVVKVADFGCARILNEEGRAVSPKKQNEMRRVDEEGLLCDKDVTVWHIGTLYWSSPEILLKKAYGTPADVYSFGIVLWEIMTRMPPYEEYDDLAKCTRTEAKQIIGMEKRRPTVPDFVPRKMANLIQNCWVDDQKSRPRFSSVVTCLEEILDNEECSRVLL